MLDTGDLHDEQDSITDPRAKVEDLEMGSSVNDLTDLLPCLSQNSTSLGRLSAIERQQAETDAHKKVLEEVSQLLLEYEQKIKEQAATIERQSEKITVLEMLWSLDERDRFVGGRFSGSIYVNME